MRSGRALTNLVAKYDPVPLYFLGAENRKSPSGGCAYGIPRYSQTSAAAGERWPVMTPFPVLTVSKLALGAALDSSAAQSQTAMEARPRIFLLSMESSVKKSEQEPRWQKNPKRSLGLQSTL